MNTDTQLSLFFDRNPENIGQNLDITQALKREIRLALSRSHLSRDQIVDKMIAISAREDLRLSISKSILDGWTKTSQPERLPSIIGLVVFCRALGSMGPFRVILQALGAEVAGPDDLKLVNWARAEREKRRAAKRARIAAEILEL